MRAMATVVALAASPAAADGLAAWSEHCLSPFMTAARAAAVLPAAHDFYDLRPFSDVAPSPGGDVTPGTDRRCAVTVAGARGEAAVAAAEGALAREGIDAAVPVPATHAPGPGTVLMAARALNPRRIAVVEVREADGATTLSVERLTPEASAEALR